MKYVFLFCGSAEDQAAYDALTPEQLRERYQRVGRWFAEHQAKMGHGNQLRGPETATTYRRSALNRQRRARGARAP